ncbi:MAG: hypothetical protein U1F57_12105 [bacterium]
MTVSNNNLSIFSRTSLFEESRVSIVQSQVDGMVSSFVEEATDFRTLAAMGAGSVFYRLGRGGTLALASRAQQAAPLLRLASYGIGLGAEVSAFEGTNRLFSTFSGNHVSPNLWRWSGRGGIGEGLFHSFLSFGLLKGAGSFAQNQNIFVQHLFSDLAMVGGHHAVAALGGLPRPEGGLAEQFLHAEATNLQLGLGMSLMHFALPGLSAFERGLDLSIRAQMREGFRLPIFPTFSPAFETTGVGEITPKESPSDGRFDPEPLYMASMGSGGRRGRKARSRKQASPAGLDVEFPFPPTDLQPEELQRGEGWSLEERKADEEKIVAQILESFPDEVQEMVEERQNELQMEKELYQDRPLALFGRAVAEVLQGLNGELNATTMLHEPEEFAYFQELRNQVRSELDYYLSRPPHWVFAHHYEKSLSSISLPSLKEETVESLSEPLREEVGKLLSEAGSYDADDPHTPRKLSYLGAHLAAAAHNGYMAILSSGMRWGLVKPNLDPVNPRLLKVYRAHMRTIYPNGVPALQLFHLHHWIELGVFVEAVREQWGNFHPLIRAYDQNFDKLHCQQETLLERHQIVKRVEAFLSSYERRRSGPLN